MENQLLEITNLRKQLNDLEFSHLYEMKTMKYLLAEKDKNSTLLHNLIDDSFTEIKLAIEELKLFRILGNVITKATYNFRSISEKEKSLENTAMKQMKNIYDSFKDKNNQPQLAMSRIFLTLPFELLPADYKVEAEKSSGFDNAKYLCLMGTAGEDALWNKIEDSVGHKMIRLPEDKESLTLMPMLDKVFTSLGINYSKIIHPDSSSERSIVEGYYLAEDALESPYIPDKKFLKKHEIKSQLSIGGILPSGAVFTCFLFFKIKITQQQAETIKALAPVLQLCFKSFDDNQFYWK